MFKINRDVDTIKKTWFRLPEKNVLARQRSLDVSARSCTAMGLSMANVFMSGCIALSF